MSYTSLMDVAREARAALALSRIYVLRKLTIEEDGEVLILSGRVDSYYHKQLAQELIKNAVDGVEVENAISVVYARPSDTADPFTLAESRPDRPR